MKALLFPSSSDLIDAQLDITQPRVGVLVHLREDGQVLWIDVDGICVLRICGIPNIGLQGLRQENAVDRAIRDLVTFLDQPRDLQDAVMEGNPELVKRLKTLFRVSVE